MMFWPASRIRTCLLLGCINAISIGAAARDAGWIRVSASHFSILADADEKPARQTILRFEQMRAVFGQLLLRSRLSMPEPFEIVAFKSRAEYAQVAPIRDGQPISTSGFFLPGKDRNYAVLDLSDDQSWRSVSRPFAEFLLNYNYPPADSWFDEGFVDYFSSLNLDDKQAEIGGDPASFVPVLSQQPWLPIPQLFQTHSTPEKRSTLFRAESWIVMHYLVSQNRLSETGAYFGLVKIQNVPLEQAVQQAYGMTPAQLEQAVKQYFRSAEPLLQAQNSGQQASARASGGPVQQFPAPVTPMDIGTSIQRVPDPEAQALVAEMTLRLPEHRPQAVKDLEGLVSRPEGDNTIARRALAWADLQNHEYDKAMDELATGAEVNPKDPWLRYYRALVKYEQARATGNPTQGLANMMVDLHAVLDWDPDFAEAYDMLALAELEGGGVHAATDNIRQAIRLSPRNQAYLLHSAHIELAAKNWDPATALLNRLKDSSDQQVASTARQDLADLPTLKKYGILPERQTAATTEPLQAGQSGKTSDRSPVQESRDQSEAQAQQPAAPLKPDNRKILFRHGKLVSVDCSQPPAAVLKVAVGAGVTMKLRTDDYKSLILIGANQFSCEWQGVSVDVNYRASGKTSGDLVSLEID
jgi:tetratricopeptide (TPR) repeat protein